MGIVFNVRVSTPSDMMAVDALLSRSYPVLLKRDYPPSLLVTAIPLISRANPRLMSSGTYFVVESENGAIVGAGGWTPSAPPGFANEPDIGHVRHIVTDHRLTRLGIGRLLMDRIVLDSETSGVAQLECFSTLTAQAFYVACGFRTLAPMQVSLRPGIDFPAIHMRRLSADH